MTATRSEPARRADERISDAGARDEPGGSELSTPLDLLLSEAGRGPLRRFLPGMSGVRLAAGLARRPGAVVGRAAGLGAELARVQVGRSEVAPHPKDRRFADEAWAKNPFLKRTLQSYLATPTRASTTATSSGWASSSTTSSRPSPPPTAPR